MDQHPSLKPLTNYCLSFDLSLNTNHKAAGSEAGEEQIEPIQFVISLENEWGKAFYLTESNVLVGYATPSDQLPMLVETVQQISDQLNQLRQTVSPTWWIYAVGRTEFEERRKRLLRDT
jgi:hypothetical protein